MGFYIFFIISLLLLLGRYRLGNIRKPSSFTVIGILILILVLAVRFDIGADYSQYFTYYAKAYQGNTELKYEPLNNLLFYLTVPFEKSTVPIAIYAALTVTIIYRAVKKNADNLFIGMFTYITLFYPYAFSTVRQGLAVVIVLFSYKYLRDKQWSKYYSLIVVAGLFHYSAFIGVLFPILYKCKPKYLVFALLFASVLFVFGTSMLERIPIVGKYAIYLSIASNFGGGNFQKLFMWCVLLFLWVVRTSKNEESARILTLCTFGAVCPVIFGAHIGGRLAQYFYIFLCIAAPDILHVRSRSVCVAYLSVIILWFFSYIYIAQDSENVKTFIPYRTIVEVDTEYPVFK